MDSITIAIIDDDYVDRLISKKLIARISPGIRTIEFSSATEALQYLATNAEEELQLPDVIILDIRMPIISGWDYLEHYKKIADTLSKHPRHFVYTSSIDPEDLNSNHDMVQGVYTKPFENQSLLEIIGSGMRDNER